MSEPTLEVKTVCSIYDDDSDIDLGVLMITENIDNAEFIDIRYDGENGNLSLRKKSIPLLKKALDAFLK